MELSGDGELTQEGSGELMNDSSRDLPWIRQEEKDGWWSISARGYQENGETDKQGKQSGEDNNVGNTDNLKKIFCFYSIIIGKDYQYTSKKTKIEMIIWGL